MTTKPGKMAEREPLSVAVIGAGIAGLTAACFLRKHHKVTIYEKGGPSATTGGQGIATFPNAARILNKIGFDRRRAGSVPIRHFRSYDKHGKLSHDPKINYLERYGENLFTHFRSDLQAELLRLATTSLEDADTDGEPAAINFNTLVEDIDPIEGHLILGNGSRVVADLIIVANGIHSRLRSRILGNDYPEPKKTGMTCYRVAVSASEAMQALNGHLPEWWKTQYEQDGDLQILDSNDGTDRMMVVYPLRNTDYMNMSCVFPTRQESEATTNSWLAEGDSEEMLSVFHDYGEDFRALMNAATEVKMWELQDLQPLSHWNNGRAILVGDAAHAMTPLQGQGANMAIEDGEAFSLFREPRIGRDDVADVLKLIDGVRRPRASKVLQNTRKLSRGISIEEIFPY